jgi:lipopolysaccharide transport system permease protein
VVEYISLSELYSHKDLILQLTRKEFLGLYQQTLLGPFGFYYNLCYCTCLRFVFNNVIGISTDATFLFNLIGITL